MTETGVRVWTLTDWPLELLPTCSNPECRREIPIGARYIIIPGSIKMMCFLCAQDLRRWKLAIDVAAQHEIEREIDFARKEDERQAREQHTTAQQKGGGIRRYQFRGKVVTCPTCHKDFRASSHGRRGLQKYCSKACLPRLQPRVKNADCPSCGQMFTRYRRKDRPPQVTCSKRCARAREQGRTVTPVLDRAWSQSYPRCLGCGTTRRRHRSQGYCSACYAQRYRRGTLPSQSLSQRRPPRCEIISEGAVAKH